MNLPTVIAGMLKAQDEFDSNAYADFFSETAEVFDEGKKHKGKVQIQKWSESTSRQYKTVVKPLAYSPTKQTLKAKISGTFPGSPIVLTYQFEFKDGLIQSLKIV